MAYNPSQHQRYGQSRQRPQGSSREFANYDAPPYDPSSFEAQEAWRENRSYRQDEGYGDQDYRQNQEYRFSDDERANPNYRPDQDYELGQQYGMRNDWGQPRREQQWGSGSGYASQEWSQPQRGYRSAQFRGRQQTPQHFGNEFSSPQRQLTGSRAPLYQQGNQFSWGEGGSYNQPEGATAGWQDHPTRHDSDFGGVGAYGGGSYGGGYGMQYPGTRQRGFAGQGFPAEDMGYRNRDVGFRGRAPKGYERSDERIREDVCECLTQDPRIDAAEISVTVKSGVVTLEGSVDDRSQKYRVEDIADNVSGVKDVQNRLNVSRSLSGSTQGSTLGGDQGSLGRSDTSKVTRQ